MSAREFEIQIKREWAAKMGDARLIVGKVGLEALRGVVDKSPVDTGRFRGNWQVAIGTEPSGTLDTTDKNGGPTIAAGAGAVSAYSAVMGFPKMFLVNNLPYAIPLEEGHSSQAPGGMVALTVAEIESMFNGVQV